MNKQQIFDKVKTHLLTQMKRSSIIKYDNSICLYRGPDGLMCAAGCVIPDSIYDRRMEGKTIGVIISGTAFNMPAWMNQNQNKHLLTSLQDLHDSVDPSDWGSALKRVAETYELEYEEDT